MFGDRIRTCNWRDRLIWTVVGLLCVSGGTGALKSAWAEESKKPPAKTSPNSTTSKPAITKGKGEVASVVRKGKLIVIRWQEPQGEGKAAPKELELAYSTKSQVRIQAPATPAMVQPGSLVSAELTMNSAGELSGSEFVLLIGVSQRPSVIQESGDASKYQVVGRIAGFEDSKLLMDFGEAGEKVVLVQGEPVVSSISGRPEFLKKGAKGTIEYLPAKESGKPATLLAIDVTREEAFDPEELNGTNVTIEKTPAAGKTTSAKSPSLTKSRRKSALKSGPTEGTKSPAKDPFGVLDDK